MKKSAVVLVVFLGGAVGLAPAKTKKDAQLPKLFCNARFVSVQTYEGSPNEYLAREYPSDYDAAIGVENRIRKWGRYTVVYGSQDADLVFIVWKERKSGNRWPGQPTQMPPVTRPQDPSVNTGGPGEGPRQPGVSSNWPGQPGAGGADPGNVAGVGAVVPGTDQLEVYTSFDQEHLSGALWKHTEKNGLREPDMTLFGRLAEAVDDACSDKP